MGSRQVRQEGCAVAWGGRQSGRECSSLDSRQAGIHPACLPRLILHTLPACLPAAQATAHLACLHACCPSGYITGEGVTLTLFLLTIILGVDKPLH